MCIKLNFNGADVAIFFKFLSNSIKKHKVRLLWITIILIIAASLSGVGYIYYSENKRKERLEEAVTSLKNDLRESSRKDSIIIKLKDDLLKDAISKIEYISKLVATSHNSDSLRQYLLNTINRLNNANSNIDRVISENRSQTIKAQLFRDSILNVNATIENKVTIITERRRQDSVHFAEKLQVLSDSIKLLQKTIEKISNPPSIIKIQLRGLKVNRENKSEMSSDDDVSHFSKEVNFLEVGVELDKAFSNDLNYNFQINEGDKIFCEGIITVPAGKKNTYIGNACNFNPKIIHKGKHALLLKVFCNNGKYLETTLSLSK